MGWENRAKKIEKGPRRRSAGLLICAVALALDAGRCSTQTHTILLSSPGARRPEAVSKLSDRRLAGFSCKQTGQP